MTPFRKSQALHLLEGVVRTLAPQMQTDDGLREALCELAVDRALWLELEMQRRPLPEPTKPAATPNAPLLAENTP